MKIAQLYYRPIDAQLDGGAARVVAFSRALRDLGHDVVLVSPKAAGEGSNGRTGLVKSVKQSLLPMPLRILSPIRELDAMIEACGADLVLSHYQPFHNVALRRNGWLDYMDAWGPFCRLEAQSRHALPRLTTRLQAEWVSRRELRESASAKLASVAGMKDRDVLRLPEQSWLPTPIVQPSRARVAPRTLTRTAGTFANWHYWPNRDALAALLEDWATGPSKRGWQLVLAGYGASELDLPPHVLNLGPVDNPAEFYSLVDVVLAPLSLGGGMKVKIVEALLAGVPVVASAAAAEGIPNEVADLLIPWTELQRLDSLLPVYADRILQVSARTALDPFTQNGFRQRVERFLLWEQ